MKETSNCVIAAAVVVPHDPQTQIFATEIIHSSGKQNFNHLRSCSRQLQNLNNWLQEAVRSRLVRKVGVAEFVWETCCVLKDVPNIPLFSEFTYIHIAKTSFLLCVSSSFEFFLFVFVAVSKSNNCMLKSLWIIYLLSIFPCKGVHIHFLLNCEWSQRSIHFELISESLLNKLYSFVVFMCGERLFNSQQLCEKLTGH